MGLGDEPKSGAISWDHFFPLPLRFELRGRHREGRFHVGQRRFHPPFQLRIGIFTGVFQVAQLVLKVCLAILKLVDLAFQLNPDLGVALFGLRFELLNFGDYFFELGLGQFLILLV